MKCRTLPKRPAGLLSIVLWWRQGQSWVCEKTRLKDPNCTSKKNGCTRGNTVCSIIVTLSLSNLLPSPVLFPLPGYLLSFTHQQVGFRDNGKFVARTCWCLSRLAKEATAAARTWFLYLDNKFILLSSSRYPEFHRQKESPPGQ